MFLIMNAKDCIALCVFLLLWWWVSPTVYSLPHLLVFFVTFYRMPSPYSSVRIGLDNFYLFKLCLNALICSHYVWLLLFVQIMFDYEFSACPVSHVCDQSCLSSVLRLMMVNSVAVDACCGFVHCCLLFSSIVQCCSVSRAAVDGRLRFYV